MLGKLSWAAIPFDEPLPLAAAGLVGAVLLGVLAMIVWKGWMPYLWREWITSVDHKRIGVMYCVLALVMLIRGFVDALMMRSQQALAYNSDGYPGWHRRHPCAAGLARRPGLPRATEDGERRPPANPSTACSRRWDAAPG